MLADIDKNGNSNIYLDKYREDLEKIFELFIDDNNNDKIDIGHLKRVFKELNIKKEKLI